MPESYELTRPVLTQLNDDGSHTARSTTSGTDFKIRAACLVPSRLVVPIVFLPGIMGTRLKSTQRKGQPAWFPPEGTWDAIKQLLQNLGRDAADRQTLLNPDTTEVDDSGPARLSPEASILMGDTPGKHDAERARWRGWTQVHNDSYGGILQVLEARLAGMLDNGCDTNAHWQAAVMRWQDAAKLGAQKAFVPLDDDALRRAASVFHPVHVVGYNWLQSNRQSAERLAREIERILGYYAGRKLIAEKVILVTHSMGGLVARACARLPGMEDKIMGVVHGVMPAIGAPATYKRMRAGFEGIEQIILGRDAAECTAVMSHAPGALELLPTPQYRTHADPHGSRHWLRASRSGDNGAHGTPLGEGDPYENIYLNNQPESWWRLVKEELIDPAGRKEREKAGNTMPRKNQRTSDFDNYAEVMDKARQLHDFIADKYHPNTYAFYAADAKRPSWNEVHWECSSRFDGDYTQARLAHDDLNGSVRLHVGSAPPTFRIAGRHGPGDGTVPAESGAAPTPHVVQIFRHEGQAKQHTSYDHQAAYDADIAQATTLYSICRILADSPWLTDNLHKA